MAGKKGRAPKPRPKRPEDRTLQLESHQILIRPLITEKSTHLAERRNTYVFQVHLEATKTEIRAAVEELFDVKVLDVRTTTRKPRVKRTRMVKGQTAAIKKAYVKLHENDSIALF